MIVGCIAWIVLLHQCKQGLDANVCLWICGSRHRADFRLNTPCSEFTAADNTYDICQRRMKTYSMIKLGSNTVIKGKINQNIIGKYKSLIQLMITKAI